MSAPPHFPRSGGILMALAIVTGAVVGTLKRQPSIGFVAGLAVGLALLLLVWLSDRRR
jgi:UDP-N-acetylmuramyl pentapeptide phosphotransferase/UDP-N-acetylglucosamine-1-phosphate transferase